MVRARGGVDHAHVVLGAHLQEALDAGGGVVRPLSLVAVGEEQDHGRGLRPLLIGRGDELVDDRLRAVHEVAELGLPQHEGVGALHGVAVLEAEGGVLGQQRVVDPELRLVLGEVPQRRPRVAGDPVVEHRVALREGAALGVLARQADRHALHEQRAEGRQLGEAPVDAAVDGHLGAALEQGRELGVDREALGHVDVRLPDGPQRLGRDGRGRRRLRGRVPVLGRAEALPAGGGRVLVGLREDPLQLLLVVLQGAVRLLLRDVAAAHEGLDVQLAGGALLLDEVVHARLRHRRVVALVVAAAAVADEVDDDVLVEPLAVLEGELGHVHHGLRLVAVDVEDRGLDGLGHVGGVHRGARLGRRRGEAHLVVHDHVDRAAGAVAGQLRELQDLGHDALAREGRVAVHEDRQHGEGVRALATQIEAVLLGTHDALEDRVHGLQVRGVGGEVHAGAVAGVGHEGALGAHVVLHVARARGAARGGPLELAEDLAVGLAGDVGQHVQATAVRHADGDLVQPGVGGVAEDAVQQRDEGLAALQGEALLADVLGLQERLERLRGVESAQDAQLLLAGGLGVRLLELLLEPGALGRVLDVHVLDADGAAVRVTQHAEDLAQRQAARPAEAAGGPLAVQVPQGQPVLADVEVRVVGHRVLERVHVGQQVAAVPVRVDELLDAGDLADLLLRVHLHVLGPADGLVGDAQGVEDLVVEAVLAQQEAVHDLQELARAGALDHAVVVRGGEGDRLGDRQVVQRGLGGALEGGRIGQRADADDGGLALGQAGHRVHGADAARVGQGDRGAGVVVHRQLVLAGALDEVVVRLPEAAEVEGLGGLHVRDHERAGAVRAGQVDGQAEVHVGRLHHGGLAVALLVGHVHRGHGRERADHGVADEVGEGDLAAAGAGQVAVDDHAVVDQHLGRQVAHGGGGGHG